MKNDEVAQVGTISANGERVWGVPLPIFINKVTKEPLRDQKVIERIASIYEKQGSDCWFTDDPKVFLGDDYNSNDYEKLNDIVEVWFDSGSLKLGRVKV